jgi:hypothetical protein
MEEESSGSNDYSGPFGNPDGTLEDFTVRGRFIDFSAEGSGSGIAMEESNLRKRIIFGRKGSGKTLYMRRQKAWADSRKELYVFDQTADLPPTEVVRRLSVLFDQETKTNQWMQIWRRALFIAIASLYYCRNPALSGLLRNFSPITSYKSEEFRGLFIQLFNFSEAPETAFSALSTIFRKHSNKQQLLDYLTHPLWNSFEAITFRDMQQSPPIVIYIDAIDEEFRHSPVVWMDCQKGLFYAVIRLMRDAGSANRLHVVICARDIVYSSMAESEHFTRYITDDHISVLDWGKRTTEKFLRTKVARLPDSCFKSSPTGREKTLENWLGMPRVYNVERKIDEELCDYLLRHTRMLPRDVVVLGNLLHQRMEKCRLEKTAFSVGRLRQVVSDAAKIFAKETIAQCANHFCSAGITRRDLNRAYFMRDEEMALSSDDAARAIRALIRKINKDVFSAKELRKAMQEMGLLNSTDDNDSGFLRYRIDSILWQNAAIAYRRREGGRIKWIFNWSSTVEGLTLPEAEMYGFHSGLIDECDIAVQEHGPVY